MTLRLLCPATAAAVGAPPPPGPSYNVAFFPKIYAAAGYPNLLDHMGRQGAAAYADPINWLLYQVRVFLFGEGEPPGRQRAGLEGIGLVEGCGPVSCACVPRHQRCRGGCYTNEQPCSTLHYYYYY